MVHCERATLDAHPEWQKFYVIVSLQRIYLPDKARAKGIPLLLLRPNSYNGVV
jgi:hypothetical protein